jgi:pyroglutamyl-peptidase
MRTLVDIAVGAHDGIAEALERAVAAAVSDRQCRCDQKQQAEAGLGHDETRLDPSARRHDSQPGTREVESDELRFAGAATCGGGYASNSARLAGWEYRLSATFLVTGFEPFAQHRTNASWDALVLLRERWPANIVTECLPVERRAAHDLLESTLRKLRPRAVLCTGIAPGESFRIEHRARRPEALALEPGVDEIEGRWPWSEMQSALDDSGVSTMHSHDAGQYVCESTYWSLLNHQDLSPYLAPEYAAFLHVPPASAACPLELIARAVGRVVAARSAALDP